MGCPALTYDYFSSVEAEPKSADRRNADGCMLTNGDWAYSWNAENRLISAETKTYTGTVRAHYEYSPFGKITAMTGDRAADNPFRFSSEYHDDETGLVYYNYRYYSPELGRWTKSDDIGEDGGYNLYGFVSNSSINGIDITGTKYLLFFGHSCEESGGSLKNGICCCDGKEMDPDDECCCKKTIVTRGKIETDIKICHKKESLDRITGLTRCWRQVASDAAL